jgi:radical SAM-linked protein
MKYVMKFSKRGRMAFISHLDLSRAFLRALRVAGIRPAYSEGFNPHPKMSFALPLSLGFESVSEYLDIETNADVDLSAAPALLNSHLPLGIEVTGITVKDPLMNGTLAAHVKYARYDIVAPYKEPFKDDISAYLAQPSIIIKKESRKTGKISEMDIKPQIASFEVISNFNRFIRYNACLASSSGNLLNPKVLIESYYNFIGAETNLSELGVMRTEIIFK